VGWRAAVRYLSARWAVGAPGVRRAVLPTLRGVLREPRRAQGSPGDSSRDWFRFETTRSGALPPRCVSALCTFRGSSGLLCSASCPHSTPHGGSAIGVGELGGYLGESPARSPAAALRGVEERRRRGGDPDRGRRPSDDARRFDRAALPFAAAPTRSQSCGIEEQARASVRASSQR